MMPVRSILAAVDFSAPSRVALEFAARLANQHGATLHVLHAQDPLLAAAAQSEGIDLVHETRDELARFTAAGVAVDPSRLQHHVVTGRSTFTICDLAAREGVDVIVLGMHGMSGAARVLFGSTTQGVLQQSAVPVFVIPDSWTAPQPGSRDLSGAGPVLVAVECSAPGLAAAAAACQLARTLSTSVSAIHVVEQLNVLERWSGHAQAAMDEAVSRNRKEIETALAGLKADRDIPLRIETGSVAERIAEVAAPRKGEHPILVLGRHARGSRRGVPGATAYRVLGMTHGSGAHALRARGVSMRPASLHVEPHGAAATARHYIRDLVYGGSDGIITTFAVVSGVAGGQLSQVAVLVVGAANLAADGVSMGVGNFMAIRADERAREVDGLPELERHPWKHGLATLLAFVVAGAVPLVPYVLPSPGSDRLLMSTVATFGALYVLGAARAVITRDRWWLTGLESLALGAVVAGAAYAAGRLVAAAVRL